MNKKYIAYQIKQYLPLMGVILSIFIVTLIVDLILSARPLGLDYGGNLAITYQNPLLATSIASLCLPFFIPLFVFNYKYSIKKADTYVQVPLKGNSLRITNYLLGYLVIVIPYIAIFLIGTLIILFVQISKNPYAITLMVDGVASDAHITFYYNYGYLLLLLVVTLIFIYIEYSFNAFVAYLANNMVDAVIYIVIFFVLRMFIFYAIPAFILSAADIYVQQFGIYYWGLSFLPMYAIIFSFFNPLITFGYVPALGYENVFIDNIYMFSGLIVSISVSLILSILITFYMIYFKDKRKENYGRKRNDTFLDCFIPHLTMALCFVLVYTTKYMGVTLKLTIFLSYLIFYYCLLALLNKSFKIKKYDLISGSVVIVFDLAFLITSLAIEI